MKKLLVTLMCVAMVLALMPAVAFAETGTNTTVVNNATELVDAMQVGGNITLGTDVELNTGVTLAGSGKNIVINLNEKRLTIKNDSITVKNGAELELYGGKIQGQVFISNKATIAVEKESSVILNSVEYNTDGVGLYPKGDAAKVIVNNSKISAPNSFAVGTNASTVDNYDVEISLNNSTFEGSSPVLINVPGKLNVKNCIINGVLHGVIVRGGTAVIEDSIITQEYDDDDAEAMANYFNNSNSVWGQGNMLNLAAITIGNKAKSGNNSYNYPSNVTLINSNFKVAGSHASLFPAVYVWANSDEGKGVTITYDNSTFEGNIVYGNDGENTTIIEKKSVTFDNNGQKTVEKIVKGNKVTKPVDPTKEGYKFLGWYLGNEKYDFNAAVTENITLTAKYEVVRGKETVEIPTVDTKEPVKEVTVGVKTDSKTENMLKESATADTTLSQKIEAAINTGKDVETKVNVSKVDVTNTDSDTKKDIQKVETTAKEKELKIAEYIDLSVLVISDGVELGKITETKEPLIIQIAIPEELKKEGRVFKVVRVHDGAITVLDTKEENGVLTFTTDKFSTYALAYEDPATTTPTKDTPKTGDATNMLPWLALMAVAGAGAAVFKKKED